MMVELPVFEFLGDTVNVLGKCYLEDPFSVWGSFCKDLTDHISYRKKVTINFKLEGFGTSSNMYLSKIFKILDEMSYKKNLEVNWYYLEIDEDMEFHGENFKELSKKLTVNLIPVQGQRLI